MKILNLLCLATIFFAETPAWAANEELYRLTVTNGDAITEFRVEKRGSRNLLITDQIGGSAPTERSVSADDLIYFAEKVKAVPPAREAGCGRTFFRLSGGSLGLSEIKACGERLSASGKALRALANLLAAYR